MRRIAVAAAPVVFLGLLWAAVYLQGPKSAGVPWTMLGAAVLAVAFVIVVFSLNFRRNRNISPQGSRSWLTLATVALGLAGASLITWNAIQVADGAAVWGTATMFADLGNLGTFVAAAAAWFAAVAATRSARRPDGPQPNDEGNRQGLTDTEFQIIKDMMKGMADGRLSTDQVAQLESVLRSMYSRGGTVTGAAENVTMTVADGRSSPDSRYSGDHSGLAGQALPSSPASSSLPSVIGPYTIVGELGHSGLADVYLGRSASGKFAAVKTLHVGRFDDPEFRARFRREINAARRVGGDFTARLITADPDAEPPWLATEYIPAPPLSQLIEVGGALPPPGVRWLAASCVRALDAIHGAGIVHRDMKPSNVLVALDGVRVIDFGIARVAGSSDLTKTGMALGTPTYMAPEQLEGQLATPATDVFSLGATLLFAASGHGPYPSDGIWYSWLLAGQLDLSGVPAELTPLITDCMRLAPSDRPTVTELLSQLEDSNQPSAGNPSGSRHYLPERAASLIRAYLPDGGTIGHPTARDMTGYRPPSSGSYPLQTSFRPARDLGGPRVDPHPSGDSILPMPAFFPTTSGAPDQATGHRPAKRRRWWWRR